MEMDLSLHAELIEDRSAGQIDTSKLIKPGVFRSEKLVNMAKHDYALEPNAMYFRHDMKWLIFRSNTERHQTKSMPWN